MKTINNSPIYEQIHVKYRTVVIIVLESKHFKSRVSCLSRKKMLKGVKITL